MRRINKSKRRENVRKKGRKVTSKETTGLGRGR